MWESEREREMNMCWIFYCLFFYLLRAESDSKSSEYVSERLEACFSFFLKRKNRNKKKQKKHKKEKSSDQWGEGAGRGKTKKEKEEESVKKLKEFSGCGHREKKQEEFTLRVTRNNEDRKEKKREKWNTLCGVCCIVFYKKRKTSHFR